MSCVAVAAVTVARVAPKYTMLFAGVVLKLVPVMVTVVPMGPLVGEKEVRVGTNTVKLAPLEAVLHPTATEIVPVVAPTGTVVVILVTVLAVTTAAVPLKLTMLFDGVVSKLIPVMVTEAPIDPEEGVNEAMAGGEILAIVLRSTDTVLLLRFTTARSAFPSPSRSPMETE